MNCRSSEFISPSTIGADMPRNADTPNSREPNAPSTNSDEVPDGEEGSINDTSHSSKRADGSKGTKAKPAADRAEGNERRIDDL